MSTSGWHAGRAFGGLDELSRSEGSTWSNCWQREVVWDTVSRVAAARCSCGAWGREQRGSAHLGLYSWVDSTLRALSTPITLGGEEEGLVVAGGTWAASWRARGLGGVASLLNFELLLLLPSLALPNTLYVRVSPENVKHGQGWQ